jgi:hypothetical protein
MLLVPAAFLVLATVVSVAAVPVKRAMVTDPDILQFALTALYL